MGIEGLDFQVVPVDFSGGLDTRTNPKMRIPGKWDSLVNCVLSKDGTPTKRDGVRALEASTKGHGLATFDSELLSIRGSAMDTMIMNPSVTSQQVVGQLPFCHLDKKEIVRATNGHDSVDCAYGLGLEVYVFRRRDIVSSVNLGVWYCVVDSTTRAQVVPPMLLSTAGVMPRVVFVQDAFMFFWRNSATNALWSAVYLPGVGQGPSTSLGITIGTIGFDAVGFGFDAVTTINFTAAVSYVFTDGVTSVRCSQVRWHSGTLVPAVMTSTNLISEADLPNADICGIAVGVVGGFAGAGTYATTFVASVGGGMSTLSGVAGNAVNDAWAASTATLIDGNVWFGYTNPTHVATTRIPMPGVLNSQVYVDGYADTASTGAIRALRTHNVTVQGPALPLTVVSSATLINSTININTLTPQGPFIAGAPFLAKAPVGGGIVGDAGNIVLPVYYAFAGGGTNELIQSGIFLLDGISGEVVGKALYGHGGDANGPTVQVPSTPRRVLNQTVARTGIETFIVPVLESGRLRLLDSANLTESGVAALIVTPNMPIGTSLADAWAPRRTQLGRSTLIANGMLSMYDGDRTSEAAFNVFPEGITVGVSVGGGTWAAGTYEFCAIYEWVDGQGQRHQSAPSPTVQAVIPANATVTFVVPTLMLTQRTNVRHVLYGTQPNGITMTRFGTLATPFEIPNNKAQYGSSTVVLEGPPASNELLYSQPFVADTTLPNDAPGPCSVLGIHQQRLWIDLSDRVGDFRYSQQLISGIGIQFNEVLGGQLPVEAGRIVGFASLDEMVIILAERKLFRITGTGPSASGGYNNYSDPVEIPSDVGCNSSASVIVIPDGVMFRSSKGWYLLTRDLSVKYVGGPVKRWDADIITSVVLMEDRQEIRVSSRLTTDSEYPGALQLCYSYVSDVWSVFAVSSSAVSGISTLQVLDAVWWTTIGRYVTVSYVSGLSNDTPGTYMDYVGSSLPFQISMSARSSFLHLSALNGFQRVRWLYLTASAPAQPATTLSFRVDFDDLYQMVNPPGSPGCYLTSQALNAITFANPAAIDLRHKLHRQKCKSVAITITELPTNSGAVGLTGFQSLALQIGTKRGTNKLPPGQKVG